MKATILSLLALVAVAAAASTPPNQKEAVLMAIRSAARQKCVEELKIDNALVDKFIATGKDDPALYCYQKCFMQTLGLLSDKEEYNTDSLKGKIDDSRIPVFEKCVEEVKNVPKENCENAGKYVRCAVANGGFPDIGKGRTSV